jgi:hypothetical protein
MWASANSALVVHHPLRAPTLDDILHADRLTAAGAKRQFRARLGDLPDGAMIAYGEAGAALWWGGRLLPWTPAGYAPTLEGDLPDEVAVLTPESVIRALAAGFRPEVHPTAPRPS